MGKHVIDIIKSHEKTRAIPFNSLCYEIPVLLRTAALLHDMGNPPFGHIGEETIKDWLKKAFSQGNHTTHPDFSHLGEKLDILISDFKNYEGNAQLFRLLTTLDEIENEYNVTYALLSIIMKYPVSSSEAKKTKLEDKKPGYYYSEKDYFNKMKEVMGLKGRHPLTFILEAADDISYLSADLIDEYKRNLVGVDVIKNAFNKHECFVVVKKLDEYIQRSLYENDIENKSAAMKKLHGFITNILVDEVKKAFD